MTGTRVGPPTLIEVSALAGVSRATASRVINGSPRVSPEAKLAVEEAIATLRYSPNRAARSLVTRRTDTIALVLSEPTTQVFSDPFFAHIVRGLSTALSSSDLTMVLLTAQGEHEQTKVARYAREGHVDGVILMSLHREDSLADLLTSAGVPLVLCGRPFDGRDIAYVDADNRGGARTATEHLLGLGRRRIGTVTGPPDMVAGHDRHAGFVDAMPPGRGLLVADGGFDEDAAAVATATLLEAAPELDGLFVASDSMAVGALRALRAAGRRVPDDVAVVGFDDAAVAGRTDPPLTTVAQPLGQMTELLIDLLVGQVHGEHSGARHRVCPTTLVRRASA